MTSARVLVDQLADLLARERVAMAEFLVALAEFDRRRLWVELGHSSLFYFLHRELGLSKGAAHYRKTAAELVRNHPEIVEPLRDGRLCITSIVQLAKVLTPENRREVLPRFFQKSKREAMFVAAELRPEAAAPRRVDVTSAAATPGPVADSATAATPVPLAAPCAVAVQPVELDGPSSPVPAGAPRGPPGAVDARSTSPRMSGRASADSAQPLSAALARLHVTVSTRFLQKLEAARAALSHSDPGAGVERILETGLDLILKRHADRRGIVRKPRNQATAGAAEAVPVAGSRRPVVPAAVKREVWLRDGGRCQWPLVAGGVCGSTLRIEFDHSIAWARAGPTTADNVRLLCRMHNDLAARRTFGDEWMNQFTGKRRIVAGAQTRAGAQATVCAQTTIGLPSG